MAVRKVLVLLLAIGSVATAAWMLGRGDPTAPSPEGPGDAATVPVGGPAPATGGPAGTPSGVRTDDAAGPNPTSHRREQAGERLPEAAEADLEVLVLDADTERPVGNTEVRVVDPGESTPFAAAATTDERGTARFTVPTIHPRQLVAFVPGGEELWFALEPGRPKHLTIHRTAALLVEGRVVDENGRGLADAELCFLPWVTRFVPEFPRVAIVARSATDGGFRVALPSAGHLGAMHPGFSPSSMRFLRTDPKGGPTVEHGIRLVLRGAPTEVHGLVVDATGSPVPFAIAEFCGVALRRAGTDLTAPPIRLRTDSEGRFATTRIAPGLVRFEVDGDELGCARGEFRVERRNEDDLRIVLGPRATLTGVVTDSDDEHPIPGVLVQCGDPADLLSQSTATDADGRYRLEGLPAGPARVLARERRPRQAGRPPRRAIARVELPAGGTATWSPRLESLAGARLVGSVVDARLRPLEGWRVLVRQRGTPGRQVRTDGAGRFEVPADSEAILDLQVYAPTQELSEFAAAVRRGVRTDDGPVLIEIDATAPSTVTGLVASDQGLPLPATVTCWHVERRQAVRATARDDGTFRVDGVPPGSIVVRAEHPGFVAARRAADVQAGLPLDLGRLSLTTGSVVRGTVTTPAGPPPEVLTISIQTESRRFLADYADGSYAFDAVPPGSHRLLVQGTGIAASSSAIEVPAETELVQDLIVVPGISRRILVHAPSDAGRSITLALQRGGEPYTWIASAATENGVAEFSACMAAGDYEAVAWDDRGREGRGSVRFAGDALAPAELRIE